LKFPARHSMQRDAPSVVEASDLTATIVICTRNRPALLRKCLEGVAHLERTPDEVIVVDNTSGDDETEALAREFEAIYTTEPVPGASRARNRGLAESHSEIVAYLDDDATPDVHWLGNLLAPFADPHVAAVSGKVVTPQSLSENNARQSACFITNKDPEWFEIATYGGLALASNMALRRRACTGQRVFDERLGRGAPFQIGEEHYAFAYILSRGYTAAYLPDAIVFHPSPTHSEIKEEARNSMAYTMLMFSEFPGSRVDLLRFLFRRMRRKPLTWPRDAPDPGEIITSGWRVLLAASLSAVLLFFRTKKSKNK
jgi:glycosyltransferase involved in cell wall biosynthesis